MVGARFPVYIGLTKQLAETFKVDEINQTVYIIGFSHG